MADEYHECGQTISKSDSDISSPSECSRRASPNGVTILIAAGVTGPDELAYLDLKSQVGRVVKISRYNET
jgi:hypothetical protein